MQTSYFHPSYDCWELRISYVCTLNLNHWWVWLPSLDCMPTAGIIHPYVFCFLTWIYWHTSIFCYCTVSQIIPAACAFYCCSFLSNSSLLGTTSVPHCIHLLSSLPTTWPLLCGLMGFFSVLPDPHSCYFMAARSCIFASPALKWGRSCSLSITFTNLLIIFINLFTTMLFIHPKFRTPWLSI